MSKVTTPQTLDLENFMNESMGVDDENQRVRALIDKYILEQEQEPEDAGDEHEALLDEEAEQIGSEFEEDETEFRDYINEKTISKTQSEDVQIGQPVVVDQVVKEPEAIM